MMLSKLAFNPQAPSQPPAPMSYAGAAARSSSGSGSLQKTASTGSARNTNGEGPDDDLFDMDEA